MLVKCCYGTKCYGTKCVKKIESCNDIQEVYINDTNNISMATVCEHTQKYLHHYKLAERKAVMKSSYKLDQNWVYYESFQTCRMKYFGSLTFQILINTHV